MTRIFLVAAFVLMSSPVFAFSLEEKTLCMADAIRLCLSEIPNVEKITACMVKHKAEVSPACRALMDRENRK